jgi:hypothetical protein
MSTATLSSPSSHHMIVRQVLAMRQLRNRCLYRMREQWPSAHPDTMSIPDEMSGGGLRVPRQERRYRMRIRAVAPRASRHRSTVCVRQVRWPARLL